MSPEIEKNAPIVVTQVVVAPKSASTFLGKLGLLLIVLSGIFFFALFAVPWLPITGGQKVMTTGALLVTVEVCWWVGAVMVGPTVVGAIKSWFRSLWPGKSGR